MKPQYLSAFFLTLCSLPPLMALGQKLSPDAEVMLALREHGGCDSLATMRAPATPTAIKAFIQITDENVIDSIRALGVEIHHAFGNTLTANLPVNTLRSVSDLEGVEYVQMGAEAQLLMDNSRQSGNVDSIHSNKANVLPRPFTGRGIVVGVIDTGFEYAHPAFQTSGGQTRIKAVWDQSSTGRAPSPSAFGYGSELTTPEQFNEFIVDNDHDFHGTHTTSIATGSDFNSKYYGVATDAEIVLVSMGTTNVDIANGIKYIFDYADRVDKPCVINMSLGSQKGPHDGTSFLDKIIDSMTGPGRIIVGAAGNEGQYPSHCGKVFTTSDTKLHTLLDIPSTSYQKESHKIEVWGTPDSSLRLRVVIIDTKTGEVAHATAWFDTSASGQLPVGQTFTIKRNGLRAQVNLSGVEEPIDNHPYAYIQISGIDMSETTDLMLGIEAEGQAGASVHMWNLDRNIFTDGSLEGFTCGDNSYTICELGGTAKSIVTVGAYNNHESVPLLTGSSLSFADEMFHLAPFSSLGPTTDGRTVPHVVAAGSPVIAAVNKYALPSPMTTASEQVKGKDGKTYYYQIEKGTSMAAPFVTGTVALWLEAAPKLTPDQVKEIIALSSSKDDFMGSLPNDSYGHGRINALEGLRTIMRLSASTEDAIAGSDFKVWADREAHTLYITGVKDCSMMKVYDVTGRLVATLPVEDGVTASFDTSAWGSGVFVITPCGSSDSQPQRILI